MPLSQTQIWDSIQSSYLGLSRSLYSIALINKSLEYESNKILSKEENGKLIIDADIRITNSSLLQLLVHCEIGIPEDRQNSIDKENVEYANILLTDLEQKELSFAIRMGVTSKTESDMALVFNNEFDIRIDNSEDKGPLHFYLHKPDVESSHQIASILGHFDSHLRGVAITTLQDNS